MFASYFGKEWADRMAEEVLFPRGLAVAELEERKSSGAEEDDTEEEEEEALAA